MLTVKNQTVWKQTRILLLGSALLFLINIALGFDNVITAELPRWQTLVHLHSGTLGWVTLSMFTLAIWIHTGQREVSHTYERWIVRLAWLSIGIFAGYILTFGLAFAYGRPFTFLMPVFGVSASLLIWVFAIYSVVQLRRQPVVTTVHLLVTTALIVAALGSTMGVLLGLEYIVGSFIPGADRIGTHAAAMDAYLLLSAAAIVGWFTRKDPTKRWGWGGLALAVAWGLSGLVLIPALLFNVLPLAMVSVPLLLLGVVLFVVKMGWQGVTSNPLGGGAKRWIFFGTLWTIFWTLFFVWVIVTYLDDIAAIPGWVAVVFAHAGFVGMMTNLLLGVFSERTRVVRQVGAMAETASIWGINLGLVLFLALEFASGAKWGAAVMGTGILVGVGVMVVRLVRIREIEDQPVPLREVATETPIEAATS